MLWETRTSAFGSAPAYTIWFGLAAFMFCHVDLQGAKELPSCVFCMNIAFILVENRLHFYIRAWIITFWSLRYEANKQQS